MWWKLTLAFLAGAVAVVVAAVGWFNWTMRNGFGHVQAAVAKLQDDDRRHHLSLWSSAGKDWPSFSAWLRYDGRRFVAKAARQSVKVGMSEAEIRATLGPPDHVIVGDAERIAAGVSGSESHGLYLYKSHLFPKPTVPIGKGPAFVAEALLVRFDQNARALFAFPHKIPATSVLADFAADTRTERRIAP